MKLRIGLVILLGSVALVRADETIAKAQEALKDQGFYYGEITGEKNAATTAAIRRYQIRNGLQITGELDSETLLALQGDASTAAQPTVKIAPSPKPPSVNEYRREPDAESRVPVQPFASEPPDRDFGRPPVQPFPEGPQARQSDGLVPWRDRQLYPPIPQTVIPPGGGLLAGTPYAAAPPEVQRDVVASAQSILASRNLYRGDIDGVFGPNTEFSVRAYQSRVGLPVTGRLDLETLAGLELLPGADMRAFTPRRPIMRRPPEPVVRGEWIRE